MLIKLEEFYNYILYERNLSNLTYLSYSRDIDEFEKFCEKEMIKFEDIDHITIRSYNSMLMMKNNTKRTIARKNSSLRTYYRFLNKNKYYDSNPFIYVERQKIDKKLPEVLTVQEITEILKIKVNKCEEINARNKCIVLLLYSTGLRCSEIVNVKLNDINFEDNSILVLGKGNKQRYVLFLDKTKEELLHYINYDRVLLDKENSPYLFLNKSGSKLTKRSIELFLQEMGKRLSVPKRIYPHIFRHSFATHLLDGGADLRVIQELLGHESIQATQVYTHLSNKTLHDNYRLAHPHSKRQ